MHTVIITAEALSIIYLLIFFISMLFGDKKHHTSIAFIACLGVAIIGIGMDLLSYILEYTSVSSFLLTVVNMLSFFGYDFELMSFAIYVWTIVAEKEKISRHFVRYISILCFIDFLFVIFGTVFKKLFLIENGSFVTGPWYNLGGVIGFVVLVSLLVFAFKKRKNFGDKPLIFIVIFFITTYTSIFITLFTGLDSYMYVSMVLVMILVYIILQRGEIESGQIREKIMFEISTTDALTKLNNRRAFESVLAESTNISDFGVIFCDVNGLKTTNDKLGHAAGDALLMHFSELLKNLFPALEIFRISGDEFVILRSNIEEAGFWSDVQTLKNVIAEQQDIASVGCAYGNSNVLNLLSIAEQNMYDDKKAYYERHGLERRRT